MFPGSITEISLPDWYLLERKAEKSIEKLHTVKELEFYLRNSDAWLRRLAILRLAGLKLKDSLNMLKEMLEDPTEIQGNRELAAWAIKATALRWNMDLFIDNRLLNQYSGNERLSELFPVNISCPIPSPAFKMSSVPQESRISLKSSDIRSSFDNSLTMELDWKSWLKTAPGKLCSNSFKNLGKSLAAAGQNLKKAVASTGDRVKEARSRTAPAFIGINEGTAPRLNISQYTRAPEPLTAAAACYRPSIRSIGASEAAFAGPAIMKQRLKSSFAGLIYWLLFPVRILVKSFRTIFRNKAMTLAFLVLMYCFFVFTTYGRVFTLRYFGTDLKSFHMNTVENAKQAAGFVWSEFGNITGIRQKGNAPADAVNSGLKNTRAFSGTESRVFIVSSKKGLNIRVSPSSSADKAGKILAYGETVAWLGKSQKDSKGSVWYFVKSSAGIQGWVYSGSLQKKEEPSQ